MTSENVRAREWRLTFLGDAMCDGLMLGISGGGGFSEVFEPLRPLLAKSDYVFANLETPISGDRSKWTRERYSFCSPVSFARAAQGCGIDFVSTANNHCLDRGVEGLEDTIRCLDAMGLDHTGARMSRGEPPYRIVDAGGLRIAVLAYTYGTNAFANGNYLGPGEKWRVNLFQDQELHNPFVRWCSGHRGFLPARACYKLARLWRNKGREVYERVETSLLRRLELRRAIRRAMGERPDLVVMLMHAGGQFNPSATQDTVELSERLHDMGVDVVAGAHEHVVHGSSMDTDGQRQTAYCLGNLTCSYGALQGPWGVRAEYSIAWHVYVRKDGDGAAQVSKTSFSVLKSIRDDDSPAGVRTVPVRDLFREERDPAHKAALLADYGRVVADFAGMRPEDAGEPVEELVVYDGRWGCGSGGAAGA